MATTPDILGTSAPDNLWSPGPVTARRQRATLSIYVAIALIGLIPLLVRASPWLQAAGIGLWFPGAGFLAVGGWWMLLTIVTIVLFLFALFAWFGSGMIVAPIAIWLGSSALAAALAGDAIWKPSPYIAAAALAAAALEFSRRNRRQVAAHRASAKQRAAFLPQELIAVAERAAAKPHPATRELSDDELGGGRYLLDRALQPLDRFDGFDRVDIFQTAAVRYQLNFLGYGLSQMQRLYTPNFHGYMSLAQRNVIEKFLNPVVWRYWIYESIWGHLNFSDWNPADRDNIMLTGYYGKQVALYTSNTGDMRYTKPGSLTFRLNKRLAWPHDLHSITKSVYDNSINSAYCLYPCEPNWIYPGCNFHGMMTMVAHDTQFGTNYVASLRDPWLRQLDAEFTNAAGSIIGLRSSLTGIAVPFPSSELNYCTMAQTFAPERAQRMWALVQFGMRRMLADQDGKKVLTMPDMGIDFGNYRRGALTFAMSAIRFAAHEFGDEELAEAATNTLDTRCGRVERDGVLHYSKGSNLANIAAAAGRFMRRDDFRDLFTQLPPPAVLAGPILDIANYPDVLVARAYSSGDDLDLVLVPGVKPGSQRIGLSRLTPGRAYRIAGLPELDFAASAAGTADLTIQLDQRRRFHILPAGG